MPITRNSQKTLGCFYLMMYGRVNSLCNGHVCSVQGAGHSSEVERSLMVRWVVGSILHGGGPIELFLVPASAP